MNELAGAVLASPVLLVIARVVLASFFLIAGIFGVFNFSSVVKEVVAAALPAPKVLALAMIVTQLVGSLLLISNVGGLAWLGAVVLAGFTLLCIPLGHPFWRFDEPKRTADMQIALEHFALSGGLLAAAIASAS
ncbi:TPA: DoxX family protein [Pseudomonas putida]